MTRRMHVAALVGSVGAVAVVTLASELFKTFVPVLSLGVLSVFAVLVVALVWGMAYAVPVAVASMLAFNWFHLPPLYTFTVADGSNWFALAAYIVVAVTVSLLADRVRRRAAEAEQREREAALLADVAGDLLGGRDLQDELESISGRAAQVLGVSRARIELGRHAPPAGEAPHPLEVDRRMVGTLYLPDGEAPSLADRGRFLPALASLLAVAVDRRPMEAVGTHTVELGLDHTVSGNRNRFETGEVAIRLDDAWRRGLSPRRRAVVTALTLPLLRRYGYELRRSGVPDDAYTGSLA